MIKVLKGFSLVSSFIEGLNYSSLTLKKQNEVKYLHIDVRFGINYNRQSGNCRGGLW